MRIEFLADHPSLAETLARWHYDEWRMLMPEMRYRDFEDELRSHVGREVIPTTLVALEGDELLGSASLLAEDFPEWKQFSPWVASVFVAPAWRGRGVATALVERAVELAGTLGESRIYLGTAGQAEFYRARGWSVLDVPPNPSRPLTIMTRSSVS